MTEHAMEYRAGTVGLGGIGIPDSLPGWSCPCGLWSHAAVSMPNRPSGHNQSEATRSFEQHCAVSP